MGESFIYLGENFSFDMNNADVKAEFVTDMNKYFDILNRLLLHPKHKFLIISKYIYGKFRWKFSLYNITSTWVIYNLDSIVKEYTKRWLCLPQSANARHLYLPVKKLGMKFTLPSDTYNSSQLKTRNILKQSKTPEIRNLYKATAPKNIEADSSLSRQTEKSKRQTGQQSSK